MILFDITETGIEVSVEKEFLLSIDNHYIFASFSENNSLLKLQLISDLKDVDFTHKNITFLSVSKDFTILPHSLSNSESIPSITKFLNWPSSSKVERNNLYGCQSEIVFSDSILDVALNVIPSLVIEHVHLRLYHFCMSQNWDNGIGVLILNNNLFVCVFKNNKFALCNTFNVSNNDEVSYYIMLMLQEFQLSQEETNVELFGELNEQPFLNNHLSQYIRKLHTNQNSLVSNMKYSGFVALLENNL